ncbi:hypothetical protein PV04_00801 [Phialophora macrospora]|uniref:Uncharacterized protein n=1 Tax=Phialophora macrospora TaxID=1851006 RepID=A0A0D2FVY2_9EURO|nr:hypothetical protein PV04_00801 [Phialophora macrospora]
MKFTLYTAAAILAYALAQAGALPSPQEAGAVASDTQAAPAEKPVYYAEEMEEADDDNIDFLPYVNQPDPTDAATASIVRRAPEPKFTKINGIQYIVAPLSHWWESQSNGDGVNPVVGGNPNVRNFYNVKEQDGWPKGLRRRDTDNGHYGPPGGFGKSMGGQGEGRNGGHPAQGKGEWQGQHPDGPPAGMGGGKEHGQDGQPWKNHGGQGGQGRGPMADDE